MEFVSYIYKRKQILPFIASYTLLTIILMHSTMKPTTLLFYITFDFVTLLYSCQREQYEMIDALSSELFIQNLFIARFHEYSQRITNYL